MQVDTANWMRVVSFAGADRMGKKFSWSISSQVAIIGSKEITQEYGIGVQQYFHADADPFALATADVVWPAVAQGATTPNQPIPAALQA